MLHRQLQPLMRQGARRENVQWKINKTNSLLAAYHCSKYEMKQWNCTTFNCDFELMLNTFNWFNFAFHSNFQLILCIIFRCPDGIFTEVARALPLIWNILRLRRHENPFLVLSLNGWKWFQIARVFQRGANVSGWSKSDVSSRVSFDTLINFYSVEESP